MELTTQQPTNIDSVSLQVGTVANLEVLKAKWFEFNNSRHHYTHTKESRMPCKKSQTYIYHSICYNSPIKGWSNNEVCKAHMKIKGKDVNSMKIISLQLDHTCPKRDAWSVGQNVP